jgi:hypothetical protein
MVAGFDPNSPESSLGKLFGLLGNDLPAVVFSDDLIAKIHDSLPMILFRSVDKHILLPNVQENYCFSLDRFLFFCV